MLRKAITFFILVLLAVQPAVAGLTVVRSSGITFTGEDGINYVGMSGITLTGADGLLAAHSNGITLTRADGTPLAGTDGLTLTGADSATYTGTDGITLTGADGITLTGADGITLTGADGVTLTGADGTNHTADTLIFNQPDGITMTGANGITLTGADGLTHVGSDGLTLTGADGITLTGADGITLTGADSVTGISTDGALFEILSPAGITLTGADGITLTGADGITLTGADGITLTGADGDIGLQSLDPELALIINQLTDDSGINAVVVFHSRVTDADIDQLRQIGILGGTRFRVLPAVVITASRSQLAAVSQLQRVRSIYSNRTLKFDADPYFNITGLPRTLSDHDLRSSNNGLPYSGRNVTVAVLDTGINSLHPDLAGKVVQNVKLTDLQGLPTGFSYPAPLASQPNTDLIMGHGTLVSGIIGGSGAASNGRYEGIAPSVKLLGLSAGEVNLTHVLSGFDYLLDGGPAYSVKVVNCSFSAAAVYDPNDPVNVATKLLTDSGVNVVFSAGNTGSGNGTLNPYAAAPWVISVGATDERGTLAPYSSRGTFGNSLHRPTLVAPGTNIIGPKSIIGLTGISGLAGTDLQRLSFTHLPFYTTATGTSFSAPQVAGAIALMLEANPGLQPAAIKGILARTATPLPKYYAHEAGAGMLNTHAAVLEAAFPDRHVGGFRSTVSRNSTRFITSISPAFQAPVTPGSSGVTELQIPSDTVQATVSVAWGLGVNDLGLRVFSGSNALIGESNQLNLAGITGLREKVGINKPAAQTIRAEVRHTLGIGTQQVYSGNLVITRANLPDLPDLDELPPELQAEARTALISNLLLPEGSRFRPYSSVTRAELAESLVRSGAAPQYMAGIPLFTDVNDHYRRSVVESVQSAPGGKLIYDAAAGGRFHPFAPTLKLTAAIAYVKAAGLEQLAAGSFLPLGIADRDSIPYPLRGYVAVALNRGYISLESNRVNPNRSITRIELATALNKIVHK